MTEQLNTFREHVANLRIKPGASGDAGIKPREFAINIRRFLQSVETLPVCEEPEKKTNEEESIDNGDYTDSDICKPYTSPVTSSGDFDEYERPAEYLIKSNTSIPFASMCDESGWLAICSPAPVPAAVSAASPESLPKAAADEIVFRYSSYPTVRRGGTHLNEIITGVIAISLIVIVAEVLALRSLYGQNCYDPQFRSALCQEISGYR